MSFATYLAASRFLWLQYDKVTLTDGGGRMSVETAYQSISPSRQPEISFSVIIDELREDNVRLARELSDCQKQAVIELKYRERVEEEASQLKLSGPIRRVILPYGPNSQSRRVATIIFVKLSSGAKALEQNGTVVDKKTLWSLSERVTAPNAQPKKVTAEKPSEKAAAAARGGKANARGRGHTARGGRNARPKKKTAAELDAEMTDYFGGGGEAAAAAAADDLGMDGIS
ncbi:hypothetical protein K469DRAFT_750730 [Zopfia rhizophila CBS 207.26]|uniref:Chromatin target of PRMT1 protein C-terminal domain-containing protein n=1 Tax=Zopfia rhizophila CBS 207.26 TaxID=1314779 RepID=A0A6A6E317_9PEZI|nr:hypothetical protein K469DRAFT_750730 [Zopfia rhizophila CBS 207.26]